tara:strand:+ start:4079 stop:4252 length:174 start_codon:yes stop_codon:yes gene_type:complete
VVSLSTGLPSATFPEGSPVVGEAVTVAVTVGLVAVSSLAAVVDGAPVVDAGITVVVD